MSYRFHGMMNLPHLLLVLGLLSGNPGPPLVAGYLMDEIRARYSRLLGFLKELEFQDEVCTAFHQTFKGFQRTKPGGDGGIDGLADNFQTAYCCFGPDLQSTPRLTPKALTRKIIKKFTEDLERILELSKSNAGYALKENKELEGILGDGSMPKLTSIVCVVNCFNNNDIIGALRTAFTNLKALSRCKFVDSDCAVSIMGPMEIASCANLSESTLLRVERPGLFNVLNEVCGCPPAENIPEPARADFDAKFDFLHGVFPTRTSTIDELRDDYANHWSRRVVLNQKLLSDFPDLHLRFEHARQISKRKIRLKRMNQAIEPFEILESSELILQESLKGVVDGGIPDLLLESLAACETGFLLGTCPIDWRPEHAK